MNYYAGIDVSLECSSACVVDGIGKIVREAKVASEPEALIAWFCSLGFGVERIGLEAGPRSGCLRRCRKCQSAFNFGSPAQRRILEWFCALRAH
jgi:hypothetical protein